MLCTYCIFPPHLASRCAFICRGEEEYQRLDVYAKVCEVWPEMMMLMTASARWGGAGPSSRETCSHEPLVSAAALPEGDRGGGVEGGVEGKRVGEVEGQQEWRGWREE